MNCNDAKAKIDMYIDDLLDDAEKQRLIWHASSCPECKKALDDAIRLKKALAGLREVEPPAGLTAEAIKKAKRHRVPVWAYASAAVAAAVALLFAFSPALLPRTNGTADGEQKLMYSAASEDMAGDFSDCMPEAAPVPETSLEAGIAAAGPEVRTSGAGIDGITFASEPEFAEAMHSEGVSYYYRPSGLPENAALLRIEVSDYSVRWVYELDKETLTFEWYRTWTGDDVTKWGEQTQLLSDNIAHSFKINGNVFWSAEGRFNENGGMQASDSTAVNAYWTQDDAAFHAELPLGLSDQDILTYCEMEAVPIG